MENHSVLKFYNLIKINPSSEIWLKSMRVKIRMLKILMTNIRLSLSHQNIPFHKYQLTRDSARILFFFSNEYIGDAIKALKKIFGIYSINPALRTSNKIKNIIEKLIIVGREIIVKDDTFALRVKRSGKHDYTSHDIAVKGGQAILDSFSDLNLKVDLTNPIKKIYIEVRNEFTYIYTDVIKTTWGGLPVEKRKKIMVSDIGRLTDLLAGFFLMRRGCEVYPILFQLTNENGFLELFQKNWQKITNYSHSFNLKIRKVNFTGIINHLEKNLEQKQYICAICRLARLEASSIILKQQKLENFEKIRGISDGVSLNDLSHCPDEVELMTISLSYLFSRYPIFTPLIGLESDDIDGFLSEISENLNNLDYCQFKPKNQDIDLKNLKELYRKLNLEDLIIECVNNIEEFRL